MKPQITLALLPLLSLFTSTDAAKYTLEHVRDLDLPTPGFLELIGSTLYATSFNAEPYFLSKNGVYRIDAAEAAAGGDFELLTNELDWPNDMTLLPKEMFGFNALAVGHGFLVPLGGHTTGGVSIINLDEPGSKPSTVSKDMENWFYHKAYAIDMDGDGLLDFVTARCRDNVIPFPWNKENKGTLVWLRNPGGDNPLSDRWEETELMNGPDFLINMEEMKNTITPGPDFHLLAPQFLTEAINYIYYDESGALQNRTIDTELGNAFAAEFVDVNGDGKMDVLATNHLSANGGVFAYEYDNELGLAKSDIVKHTLADSIDNVQKKGMAPGHSFTVYPRGKPEEDGEIPYILVDGDGAENYIMLRPGDKEWEYDMEVLFPTNCTVGRSVAGDVDGDGFSEVFVPLYEKNIVRVLRFKEVE